MAKAPAMIESRFKDARIQVAHDLIQCGLSCCSPLGDATGQKTGCRVAQPARGGRLCIPSNDAIEATALPPPGPAACLRLQVTY